MSDSDSRRFAPKHGKKPTRPKQGGRPTASASGQSRDDRAPGRGQRPAAQARSQHAGFPPSRTAGDARAAAPKATRSAPVAELAGEEPLRTNPSVLLGWESAILALARLPRGTARRDMPNEEQLELVVRQEMKGVIELWETYTQERNALTRRLLDARAMAVRYLIGFHLPNAARMQLALARAARRARLGRAFSAEGPDWLWHDIAGGTGAAATALCAFASSQGLPLSKLSMIVSDGNGGLLDAARAGLSAAYPELTLRTARLAVEDLDTRPKHKHEGAFGYSLSYAWNELARNQAARSRLQFLWKGHIDRNEEALLVILEPANEVICRDAMKLRDELCATGYQPLYPCPTALPCPMLASTRDWCYSEGLWHRPHVVQWLDRTIGIDRGTISTSAFVLASPALAQRLAATSATPAPAAKPLPQRAPVVVGRPKHRDDRGFDYLLCKGDSLAKEPAPKDSVPLARGLAWAAAQARVEQAKTSPRPAPSQKPFPDRAKKHDAPGKKRPAKKPR